MKKAFLVFAQTLIVTFCFAQDIIIKVNGEEIKSKILEVNQGEIKYKKHANTNGPTYTIPKSEIFMIKYENGEKDIFNESTKRVQNSEEVTTEEELYSKGKEDAITNYKGNKSGAGGTMATAILTSPLIGLIPAVIVTTNEPANENLMYPNSSLMKKEQYRKGYTEQAFKIKKKKVWTAFGIGSGIWAVIVLLLTSG